jgi:hypothetical protein
MKSKVFRGRTKFTKGLKGYCIIIIIIIIIIKVETDRTIPNNRPDIIIRDNEKGTCMLIGVAISGDRNVIKKEAEKILKYKDRK